MGVDFSPAFNQLKEIVTGLIRMLPNVAIAIVVFLVFIALAPWIQRIIAHAARRWRKHESLSIALGRLGQFGFIFLGFLVAAVILFPEFTPGDLISVLGVGSVAIGFAFRDILQNFLAGILLLITEPFRVGDQIVFGNYEGTVEHIETRATSIRTYDGRRVVIPNGQLYTQAFTVNTAYDKRRMDVDIEIGYEDDIPQAKTVILETLAGMDDVLADPAPEVIITEWREGAVMAKVRWWVTPPKRRDILVSRDGVLQQLKAAFQEHRMAMPFPVHQVLFWNKTGESNENPPTPEQRYDRDGRSPRAPAPPPASDKVQNTRTANGTEQSV